MGAGGPAPELAAQKRFAFLSGFRSLSAKGPLADAPLPFLILDVTPEWNGLHAAGVKMNVFMDVSYQLTSTTTSLRNVM